ncbi:MAG: OFA family oxalate/formate antiporter-like MFS transporter [Acidimicrobiales bacterium]|jgi:OFA family oxalate/formate antiporter-like MFS transporter
MSPSPPTTRITPFWGWRIVWSGAAVQMLVGGLVQHAYTNYAVLLREEFGWGTTLIAFGFALNRVESGLLGPIQGWLLDRYGPRPVMSAGAIIIGIGLMLFSTVSNAVEFFAFYFIVAVGASLSGFITVVTVVVNWFDRKRSLALSLVQAGFPVGGVLIPVIVFCLERYGWRATSFGSGIVAMVLVFGLAQLMHRHPHDVGQEIDGGDEVLADGTVVKRDPTLDFTLDQAVRTRAFWFLNLGHATALLVVGSTMTHLAVYLTEEQGFTLQQAGFVGFSLLMLQLVGQLLGGTLGDLMSKQLLAIIAMVGHVTGMLLFTFATAKWMIWAFVPFHGMAWGLRGPLMQAMRADYFGASSFGRIMGWSSMIMMLGTMSGPLIVGFMRDSTGSFTPGFATVTILASVAIVFFALASKPTHPDLTS